MWIDLQGITYTTKRAGENRGTEEEYISDREVATLIMTTNEVRIACVVNSIMNRHVRTPVDAIRQYLIGVDYTCPSRVQFQRDIPRLDEALVKLR
jgi:hypothetical protein